MLSCNYIMHFDTKSCPRLGRKTSATKHLVKPGLLWAWYSRKLASLYLNTSAKIARGGGLLVKWHHFSGIVTVLHIYANGNFKKSSRFEHPVQVSFRGLQLMLLALLNSLFLCFCPRPTPWVKTWWLFQQGSIQIFFFIQRYRKSSIVFHQSLLK